MPKTAALERGPHNRLKHGTESRNTSMCCKEGEVLEASNLHSPHLLWIGGPRWEHLNRPQTQQGPSLFPLTPATSAIRVQNPNHARVPGQMGPREPCCVARPIAEQFNSKSELCGTPRTTYKHHMSFRVLTSRPGHTICNHTGHDSHMILPPGLKPNLGRKMTRRQAL